MDVTVVGLLVMFVALPISVTVAMTRHDLYGFDRLLSGTVRWITLVTVLGCLFGSCVVLLGSLLGFGSPVVAAVATLICTMVARPLHGAIRGWVDARFQPRRQRVLLAVRDFATRMRAGEAAPEDLEPVLQRALDDEALRIELTGPAARVVHSQARLTAADIAAVEREARLALELIRLRRDLREALAQTAASRERIVRAADAERGWIQRDLHDGAQQNLVAVGMRLRALERSATDGWKAEIAAAVELVQATIADLRRLAQGIRPSVRA